LGWRIGGRRGGVAVQQVAFVGEQHVAVALRLTKRHFSAGRIHHTPLGTMGAKQIPANSLFVTVPIIITCLEVPTKMFVAVAILVPSPKGVVLVIRVVEIDTIDRSIGLQIFCKDIGSAVRVGRIQLPFLHASPVRAAHCG